MAKANGPAPSHAGPVAVGLRIVLVTAAIVLPIPSMGHAVEADDETRIATIGHEIDDRTLVHRGDGISSGDAVPDRELPSRHLSSLRAMSPPEGLAQREGLTGSLMTGRVFERSAWRSPIALSAGWGLMLTLAVRDSASGVDATVWSRSRDYVVDFVTAHDKQLHFFASTSLALSVSVVTGEPRWGVLSALLAGLAKEVVWDHLLERGDPSAGDMVANAMGVGFACLVMYLGEML